MENDIFKSLADPSRRLLLDLLFENDGRTLIDLSSHLEMTRFAVMKHLRILEQSGLITTKKVGREKFHYLNPIPIQQIYDRWVSKYSQPWTKGLGNLKKILESENKMSEKPKHVYQVLIQTTPEKLWQAITDPEMTEQFWFKSRIFTDCKVGSDYHFEDQNGKVQVSGKILEADPPNRLVMTWSSGCMENCANEEPSRVTWEISQSANMPGVCVLMVAHDQFEGAPNTFEVVGKGWPTVLSGLKTLLETGEPLLKS